MPDNLKSAEYKLRGAFISKTLHANECQAIVAELDRLRALSPAAVDAVGKDCHVAVIGFRWDSERMQHVPQLLIEFEPVPAGSPNDAKGWRDRDAMAAALARSGKGSR
jgi:hypothetical protein